MSVQLLTDVAEVFTRADAEKLSTKSILAQLTGDDSGVWGDLNGRSLSARRLGQMLKRFGIRHRSLRLTDGSTPKGYVLAEFQDPLRRYTPFVNATSATPHGDGAQSPNPSDTPNAPVSDENDPGTPVTPRVADVAATDGVYERNSSAMHTELLTVTDDVMRFE